MSTHELFEPPEKIVAVFDEESPPCGRLRELCFDALIAHYLQPFSPSSSAFQVFEWCKSSARASGVPPVLSAQLAHAAVDAHRRQVRCAKWLSALHNRGLFSTEPGRVNVNCDTRFTDLRNALHPRDGTLYWHMDVCDEPGTSSIRFYIAALTADVTAARASGVDVFQTPNRHFFSLRPFVYYGTQIERYWTQILKKENAQSEHADDNNERPARLVFDGDQIEELHRLTAQSALTEAAILDAPCLVSYILKHDRHVIDEVDIQGLGLPPGDNLELMQSFCQRVHDECFDQPQLAKCLAEALWSDMPQAYKPHDVKRLLSEHARRRGLLPLCDYYCTM